MTYYCVLDYDDTHIFELGSQSNFSYSAEECAEDYYNNHDGWECFWPLKIRIFESNDLNSKYLDYDIRIEHEPVFYATMVEKLSPPT